jgi:hypothetical protein
MTCLLYCIAKENCDKALQEIRGVHDRGLFTVAGDDLWAMVSDYEAEIPIDPAALAAYGDVIEYCHRRFPVVPMRFGCIFSGGDEILSFLRKHGSWCHGLLHEFEDHVEMGVRVLGWELEPSCRTLVSDVGACREGRTFLSRRKAHYGRSDRDAREMEAVSDHFSGAFAGLYSKWKRECRPGMLSMYFLVRERDVAAFTDAFRGMKQTMPRKLLLSGPWPPYNFSVSENEML